MWSSNSKGIKYLKAIVVKPAGGGGRRLSRSGGGFRGFSLIHRHSGGRHFDLPHDRVRHVLGLVGAILRKHGRVRGRLRHSAAAGLDRHLTGLLACKPNVRY
jgi:hypothetical protein